MGRGNDLNDDEKRQIIKELGKSTPLENIAKKINRHLETVKRLLRDPVKKNHSNRGILKSVTNRDLSSLKRNLRKVPGANQQRDFPRVWPSRHPQNHAKQNTGSNSKTYNFTKKAATLIKA